MQARETGKSIRSHIQLSTHQPLIAFVLPPFEMDPPEPLMGGRRGVAFDSEVALWWSDVKYHLDEPLISPQKPIVFAVTASASANYSSDSIRPSVKQERLGN